MTKQRKIKLTADELLYGKMKRKYSLTKKLEIAASQFLKEQDKGEDKNREEIDSDYSRANKKYVVVYTNMVTWFDHRRSGRRFFCIRERGKLKFLYDAKALIEDYELNDSSFKRFSDEDPDIYFHLALAYWDGYDDYKKYEQSLMEFIKKSPDAKGENIKKIIVDYACLFLIHSFGLNLWFNCYLRMGMFKEAAIAFTFMADCFIADVNEKQAWYGYADLLLEKYKKARNSLSRGIECINEKQDRKLPSDMNYYFNDLRIWKIRYFWALGMEKWKEDNNTAAYGAFQTAKKFSEEDSREERLMEYLLKATSSNKKIISIADQFPMMNKWWEEIKVKKERAKKIAKKAEPLKQEMLNQFSEQVKSMINKTSLLDGNPIPFKEEKLEYKVWFKDSEPDGTSIDARKKDSMMKNEKTNYNLLILRDEALTQVFINGKKAKSPPGKLAYRVLSYVLKHRGAGGTAWNMFKHVWDVNEVEKFRDLSEITKALKLRERIEKGKLDEAIEKTKGDIATFSNLIRRRIADLNRLFLEKLNTKLKANDMDEFELTPGINYCLIEKIKL